MGARDFTCAFSGFGQVVIVTRAEVLSQGFAARPSAEDALACGRPRSIFATLNPRTRAKTTRTQAIDHFQFFPSWNGASLQSRPSCGNNPRLIFKNCNISPMLSGHISIFGLVFFVLKSLLGIATKQSREKVAIFPP